MFVKRDPSGRILAVSLEQEPGIEEAIADDSPELSLFFSASRQEETVHLQALRESDIALARVLEDLIDVLIDKNLIQFTDLPPMAQHKLLTRQGLRHQQHRLDLLTEEDDEDTIPM
ncbi:tryptophan synthase subunit beta like protein [Zobellella taiwanensis]